MIVILSVLHLIFLFYNNIAGYPFLLACIFVYRLDTWPAISAIHAAVRRIKILSEKLEVHRDAHGGRAVETLMRRSSRRDGITL